MWHPRTSPERQCCPSPGRTRSACPLSNVQPTPGSWLVVLTCLGSQREAPLLGLAPGEAEVWGSGVGWVGPGRQPQACFRLPGLASYPGPQLPGFPCPPALVPTVSPLGSCWPCRYSCSLCLRPSTDPSALLVEAEGGESPTHTSRPQSLVPFTTTLQGQVPHSLPRTQGPHPHAPTGLHGAHTELLTRV